MENCSDYFVPEKYKDNQYCYWFMANDTFHMVSSEDEKDTKDESVRQIDFYWSIDNLKNFTKSGISVPTITMQLYDPQFSPRRNTIGDSPKEVWLFFAFKLSGTIFFNFIYFYAK
jgi:hypothetical protein